MFDLTGKRALVTGASGGIGGASIRKMVEQPIRTYRSHLEKGHKFKQF